jgi:putative hemolysin
MSNKKWLQLNQKNIMISIIFLILLASIFTACVSAELETEETFETAADPTSVPSATPIPTSMPTATLEAVDPSAPPSPGANLPSVPDPATDPSAIYCNTIMGYENEVISGDSGAYIACKLPDDVLCESWSFLTGKCGGEYSFCEANGYQIKTMDDGQDPFSPVYGVCVAEDGSFVGRVSELSGLLEAADYGPPQ